MTRLSWIRKLFDRPVTRPIHRGPHRARLAVDALEDRWVPSRLLGTGLLDAGSVATPSQANSTGGTVVTGSSTSTIPSNGGPAFAGVLSSAPGESGGPAPTGPASYSTLANGMPILNSHPGSPVAIFLDFNSNAFNGYTNTTPYDEDGDPTTFNAVEQSHIYEAWREMSAYYGFFDVNVTTVKPAASVPTAWIAIGNNISGGYSFVGVFPNSQPESFVESGDALERVSAMAHEIGHNFGLVHQSTYDSHGNKVAEYASAPDPLHGPIMGVDFDGNVHKWIIGHPDTSPSALEDDIAVIAAQIQRFEPAGGDGFLPDDFGNTIATATPLPVRGAAQWTPGVIERLTDVDAFSFTSTGGVYAISATPDAPSGVDLKLDIYAPSGTLLASSDGANNDQQLTMSLPAGTYYALVSSHGNYGDVGQYFLSVSPLPAGWASVDVGTGVSGYTTHDGSTGTYSVVGTGTGVTGNSDGDQYAYQTLTGDGTIVARVTNLDNTSTTAQVGVMIRETVAANAREVAQVMTHAAGPQLLSRSSTGGSTTTVSGTAGTFAPTWVKLVRSGSTFTGYTSADGVAWMQLGTATVSMNSSVTVGLVTSSANVQELNVGVLDHVSVTGNLGTPAPSYNNLPAPTALAVSPGTGTGLSVSWTGVAGATGYAVDRSGDGVTWVKVATTASGVTTYSDPGLAGSHRYFYRVSALDATGRSVPSAVASAVNRPSAVTSFSVTSWTPTQLILNWRDTSGETGYRIERSTDGGVTYAVIATVGANVPSYTDGGLTPDINYYYRVTPTSPLGDGPSAIESRQGVPQVFVVTSLLDDGNVGTLRWAVGQANASGGPATITFAPAVFSKPQTIQLIGTLELSNMFATETITGPAAGVTVRGGGLSRVFLVDAFVNASISGLTITGGMAADVGGGLLNGGTTALTNCTIRGNSARYGGGLYNSRVYNGGSVTLTDCTVSGNSANEGGGLDNSGTATLTNSTVSGNSAGQKGGGLANFGGTVALTNCTVSGNFAGNSGGGLYNFGSVTLTDCTISGNSARTGGGGLYNFAGSVALTNCTVSGNAAHGSTVGGGGLYNPFGTAALTNCTITGNSATYGGGLRNIHGTATLTNCTVSGNSASLGGGLRNRGGITTLINTIVAGNTSALSGRALDISGSVTGTHNLIGTGGAGGLVNGVNGNLVGIANALLAPLGNYGGPTQTMPLLPGSPALDAGTSSGAPATDQRGLGRVGAVDIGAFESQGFTFAVVAGSTPQSSTIGTAFANALAIRVTPNNPIEPVDGSVVNFVALPVNGASAILASSAVITGGVGGVTAAPNNVLGNCTVLASVGAFSATFHLTNTGTPFAALQVNTTSDLLAPGPGLLSLREAIGFANTDPSGMAHITFDPVVFATTQTITLTTSQLELTHGNDTITGPAKGVIVNGNHANRVFQVDAGVTASISGMTLAGGKTTGNGGGLLNNGTLALSNCTVSGSSALYGGGLDNNGTATLSTCTVSGNSAKVSGGGLFNNGTATLTNCTVSGNSAQRTAGGLDSNGYGSTLGLTNCTVSGNSSPYGGGVYSNGTLVLTNCTVTGNSASGNGAGVYINHGTGTLTNCTVSGNSAGNYGGGLNFYAGSASLTNCTVSGNSAGNSGGGLYTFNNNYSVFGALTLTNTIVAGNTRTSAATSDISGSALGNNNLIGTGGSGGLVNGAGGNLVGVANALLSPLGNYGGPTQTMPLLPGSPAIDAGTGTGAPALDQRGQARVGAVDIGTFESQGFSIAVTSGGGQATNISTAFAAPLVVTVTANNPGEPVAEGRIAFTPPASGASATISGSPAIISATGRASVTATANGFAGSYTISATARGITTPASLSLANRPTLSVPAAQTAYQNVDQPISGIGIGDAPSATLTVTLSVSHGTLTLGTTTGLTTLSGNGTGTVTLIGTTANLNAALASLIYRGSHNYSGGDTLSLTATDSGVSATPATMSLTVESIAQEAANLQAQVSALQTAGVLNQGQANSLIVKLNLQGSHGDIGKVQAFLDEVAADLTAGILTKAQADALLGPGNILLLGVTRR
jgi:parallel beta-helix repeat protein